jgi:hypothetical protein
LQGTFVPWWNQTLKVLAAAASDAHRPLGPDHQLISALSHVETRRVANDYTIHYAGKLYQMAASGIRPGLRGGTVRVERRLDGSLAVRFREAWLQFSPCQLRPKVAPTRAAKAPTPSPNSKAQRTAAWRRTQGDLFHSPISIGAAAAINRTRTKQRLD